jgi:hypothetical protein
MDKPLAAEMLGKLTGSMRFLHFLQGLEDMGMMEWIKIGVAVDPTKICHVLNCP